MRKPRASIAGFIWGGAMLGCGGGAPRVDASLDSEPPRVDAPHPPDARTPGYGPATRVGRVMGTAEVSGLVASGLHPGILWAHDDSGNPAELLAIESSSATLRARIPVRGATNLDWEDIALLPGTPPRIVIGDIGDNLARESGGARSFRDGTLTLYVIDEPTPTATEVTAERIELRYPDRPYDCEALFVEPRSRDVYLLTKDEQATLFVARDPFEALEVQTLEELGAWPIPGATAADLHPDGTRLAVRGYGQVQVFAVGGSLASALSSTPWPAPFGSLAEAIAFDPTTYDLWTLPEGPDAPLDRIAWQP